MKIAVYAIALNEAKHLERWADSAKEADGIFVTDTGSTDETAKLAESLGIVVSHVEVKPWRFDVARNFALQMVPESFDLCISLDLDEVLQPGWRTILETAWQEENYWPIYEHIMARGEDGSVRSSFLSFFRVHPRKNFVWKYPIHEIVVPTANMTFSRRVIDLKIDHLPDKSKSRSSYLPLLRDAVVEYQGDWRMAHYLNREFYYESDWPKVLSSAEEAMQISDGWKAERAATCLWASEAALNLSNQDLAELWASRATHEDPLFYEGWHWRAHLASLRFKWLECLDFSSKLLVLERQNHHLVKPGVWEWWGYDLIALSSHNLGNNKRAVQFGKLAVAGFPTNERLNKNMEFYLEALKSDR